MNVNYFAISLMMFTFRQQIAARDEEIRFLNDRVKELEIAPDAESMWLLEDEVDGLRDAMECGAAYCQHCGACIVCQFGDDCIDDQGHLFVVDEVG